jgi:flagellar hook-basal body complex protein FliE
MRTDSLNLFPVNPVKAMGVSNIQADTPEKSFRQILSTALEDVNKLQLSAQQGSANLAAGKIQDVSEVVIATEKATIALQLTMQVRNKVVDAYQEIMRMQV